MTSSSTTARPKDRAMVGLPLIERTTLHCLRHSLLSHPVWSCSRTAGNPSTHGCYNAHTAKRACLALLKTPSARHLFAQSRLTLASAPDPSTLQPATSSYTTIKGPRTPSHRTLSFAQKNARLGLDRVSVVPELVKLGSWIVSSSSVLAPPAHSSAPSPSPSTSDLSAHLFRSAKEKLNSELVLELMLAFLLQKSKGQPCAFPISTLDQIMESLPYKENPTLVTYLSLCHLSISALDPSKHSNHAVRRVIALLRMIDLSEHFYETSYAAFILRSLLASDDTLMDLDELDAFDDIHHPHSHPNYHRPRQNLIPPDFPSAPHRMTTTLEELDLNSLLSDLDALQKALVLDPFLILDQTVLALFLESTSEDDGLPWLQFGPSSPSVSKAIIRCLCLHLDVQPGSENVWRLLAQSLDQLHAGAVSRDVGGIIRECVGNDRIIYWPSYHFAGLSLDSVDGKDTFLADQKGRLEMFKMRCLRYFV